MVATEMIRELARFNQRRLERGLEAIEIGIGIATGEVLAGSLGSRRRLEYTVIGDNVNLAARLEGANKHYGTTVLLAASTVEALKSRADPAAARSDPGQGQIAADPRLRVARPLRSRELSDPAGADRRLRGRSRLLPAARLGRCDPAFRRGARNRCRATSPRGSLSTAAAITPKPAAGKLERRLDHGREVAPAPDPVGSAYRHGLRYGSPRSRYWRCRVYRPMPTPRRIRQRWWRPPAWRAGLSSRRRRRRRSSGDLSRRSPRNTRSSIPRRGSSLLPPPPPPPSLSACAMRPPRRTPSPTSPTRPTWRISS